MSSKLMVRLARPDDDGQMRALLARNSMPGSISVALTTEPSFFDAIEVEGRDPKVIVGERNGRIVGAGLAAVRDVYVNGKPSKVGYLSSLRIDQDHRRTTGLARGFSFLKQLHQEHIDVQMYLTTILEENKLARAILTSGRAGLPRYHEICGYSTVIIPMWPRRSSHSSGGLSVLSSGEMDPEVIVDCLNRWGRRRQFFPVYSVDDLVCGTGLLRGLRVDDFHVAVRDGKAVGVLAYWDQTPFRQNVVTHYSGPMRFVKTLTDGLSHLLPLAQLPNIGCPIESAMSACVSVQNDDREVFAALVNSVLGRAAAEGKSFLMLGFADGDPLASVALRFLHFALRSRVYAAAWDDDSRMLRTLERDRIPYFELGSL